MGRKKQAAAELPMKERRNLPALWMWKESTPRIKNHSDDTIYGNPLDCWVLYTEDCIFQLEDAYQQGQKECSPMKGYVVNFEKMQQTKTSTGYARDIQRLEAHWMWKETPSQMKKHAPSGVFGPPENGWVLYGAETSCKMEQSYQKGKKGATPLPGYKVNFKKMEQKKESTGYVREVQRVPVMPPITEDTSQTSLPVAIAQAIPPDGKGGDGTPIDVDVTPIPPPQKGDDDIPIALDVTPIPPPHLVPASPDLSSLQLPQSWSLSDKEAKKCTDQGQEDTLAVTQRHRKCHIPIFASEIVVFLWIKGGFKQTDLDLLKVARASRVAILTRGSIQLKKMPLHKTMNLTDRMTPNIKFGIYELRSIHTERDLVLLAYFDSEVNEIRYAIYQTPEWPRFLSQLAQATVGAYVGVPPWAIPVQWSGNNNLQALHPVSKNTYREWMGNDGGFSACMFAAALSWHVYYKLDIGELQDGERAVAAVIDKLQPRRLIPTPGPKVLDLLALADELRHEPKKNTKNKEYDSGKDMADYLVECGAAFNFVLCTQSDELRYDLKKKSKKREDDPEKEMVDYLVERGLNALAFNLVFRKLKLSKYDLPTDISDFQIALAKVFLYNVTLREIDFSFTNLSGLCTEIGQALAMNAQPLISRVNFANCQLLENDFIALLPGLARIWCGGTALMEMVNFNGNSKIPTDAWDTFFRMLYDPSSFPRWPEAPPPAPSCAFLQELDLINTNAMGHGLYTFCTNLSGLRTLKISSFNQAKAYEVLFPLAMAGAPLETFVGKNLTYGAGALFSFTKTLRVANLDGFSGPAESLLCDWPEPVPKLTIKFHGDLKNATVSRPAHQGYAPGCLWIENSDTFGQRAMMHAIAVQATGLKHLFLSKMHYSQLWSCAPILAHCGLETLHVSQGVASCASQPPVFALLAPSTTLRDVRVHSNFTGPDEVAMIGQFLKTNRSVARIEFDGDYLLDVDSVKVLRSAFYGNKKVTNMQYLAKAKERYIKDIRAKTQREYAEVQRCKAAIKRLFQSHYSKWDYNWRATPNRLKLPWVEKIRVAKRKIGKMQRDSAKIGQLLQEIAQCVARNMHDRAVIEREKSRAKLERRGKQISNLATKKKHFMTKLITKLHKSKKRGRQQKSAKTQLPRSYYYRNRHMWPSSGRSNQRRRRPNSRYHRYNDPYHTRYYYDYYDGNCNDGYRDRQSTPSDVDSDSVNSCSLDAGAGAAAWLALTSDCDDLMLPEDDPWEQVDLLAQFGAANLDIATSPEFLTEIHNEAAELGVDVVSGIYDTLDVGAEISDKVTEISEAVDVPVASVESVLDNDIGGSFDTSGLELGDIPDFEGVPDSDDYSGDADDAVGMYAGAGPRDLDDGGPSGGGSTQAALAGARRRAITRKANRRLIRAREKSSVSVGYKHLTFGLGINLGEKPLDTTVESWPADLNTLWVEETKRAQIEVMSESDLLQLPEVSERNPSLLMEWSDGGESSQSEIEVVLVTQCSLDRLDNLEAQLTSWTGKASIAIYLKSSECTVEAKEVVWACIQKARYQRQARGSRFDVAVSMVEGCFDDEPYPINYLRNVALLEARRQHLRCHATLDLSAVLLVDVDFRPSANLWEALHTESAAESIMRFHRVIVCPAFEVASKNKNSCPQTTAALKLSVDAGDAEGFHLSHFPQGHSPTRFDKFWAKSTDQGSVEDYWRNSYAVRYEKLFEPYVVMASRNVPLYDERFQGYGLNKVSHLASVARQTSNTFYVLPGVFLCAPVHLRSESWRDRYGSQSDETKFNQLLLKGLYHNFMTRLDKGLGAIVSDHIKAKDSSQCLQDIESRRRRETAVNAAQLPARSDVSLTVNTVR